MSEIDQERIIELRDAISKLPGSERRKWRLEVYDLKNGQEVLTQVLDLKTGRPIKFRGMKKSDNVQKSNS